MAIRNSNTYEYKKHGFYFSYTKPFPNGIQSFTMYDIQVFQEWNTRLYFYQTDFGYRTKEHLSYTSHYYLTHETKVELTKLKASIEKEYGYNK